MSETPIIIREFRIGDEMALHSVFLSAIHDIASKDYTPEQIQAWAPALLDHGIWIERMRGICPFVVELQDKIVAYADVQPNGYIDYFFVSSSVAGTGVGTMLMNHIQAAARNQSIDILTSDVSRTAQPFFARFGFVIVEQRVPIVRGVAIPNALMRCEVTANPSFKRTSE